MGRREARKVEDRIHLDELVRVRVYTIRSASSGGYIGPASTDVNVWAAIEEGRSALDIGSASTTLTFPSAFVVRHDSRFASLAGKRVTVTREGGREDRIADVGRIGRRRFLRLEVEA